MSKKGRVIVTGSEGFVGKATCEKLEELGYDVFHYDLLRGYDVCNREMLEKIIEKDDIILHLAAVSRFASADLDPARAFKVNCGGTLNVLQAAIKKKAAKVVYSSTGSVYMPVQYTPIDEKHPIKGNSVYGWSKAYADFLVQEHWDKVPCIILRYAHLYGKEKHWGGIGNFVNKLVRDIQPTIYGGHQSNDFCYIKDIVQANIKAIQSNACGHAYNIGTGEEINIIEAYEILKNALGKKLPPKIKEARNVDAQRFVFNIDKAKSYLKYKPEYSFRAGIIDMLSEMGYL